MTRTDIALLVGVLVMGAGALWWGTDGLRVFTAETVRRQAIAQAPRQLPAVTLQDQDGAFTSFDALAGKIVLLDFIYTRCPTICITQGSDFEQAREAIQHDGLSADIALLTVSFDPEHDGPQELAEYANRFGGADAIWRFVRTTPEQTEALLDIAEVIVLPDHYGGFVHNAAIHLIDRRGRLVRILDSDAWRDALVLADSLM